LLIFQLETCIFAWGWPQTNILLSTPLVWLRLLINPGVGGGVSWLKGIREGQISREGGCAMTSDPSFFSGKPVDIASLRGRRGECGASML
jgi:hypothetical protein